MTQVCLYPNIVALINKENPKLIIFSVYFHEFTLRGGDTSFYLVQTYHHINRQYPLCDVCSE